MGLIKAALGSVGGVLADQWKEYFYCDALPENVICVKGRKRSTGRGGNNGSDNIISDGSVIAVADGQCMMIVEQGAVVDICAEPGEYTYDISTEPSIFTGDLSESISRVFANVGKRFTFGGEAPMDQRVYFFNTKELLGNKYGTPNTVPFHVVDQRAGIDMDISIRCFGEYSQYKEIGDDICAALLQSRADARYNEAQANAPKAAVTCPYCGATTMPTANGRCEYCGGALS